MKTIIIVYEEKCRKFADYLAQLISSGNQVSEDFTMVEAQVWSEKDYNSNAAQISSSQHILFIGQDRFVRDKSENMKAVFSKYGIKYGWLGKQAFISVERVVNGNEYKEFIDYAKTYHENVIHQIDEVKKKLKPTKKELILLGVGMAFPPALFVGIFAELKLLGLLGVNNKIREQQYRCAVLKFYLEGLNVFLGI